MNADIQTRLRTTIANALNRGISADTIVGVNMVEELGMTSVDALEVLIHVENEFNIMIDDSDLSQELVTSLDKLASYIDRKMAA